MLHLFDFPAHVLTGVFIDWLDLSALVALDGACCSIQSRTSYIDILTSSATCFHQLPSPPLLHSKGIQWFVARKAKVMRVVVDEGSIDRKDAWLFFSTIGSSLQHLHIMNCNGFLQDELAAMIQILTPRLQTMVFKNCSKLEGAALGAIFAHCAKTLRCIHIEHCTVPGEFGCVQLPSLQMLHVSDSEMSHDAFCQLITCCPNLRSFHCTDLDDRDECFHALADHCRHLQVLSYETGKPSTAALLRVLQACPEIEVVSISCESRDEVDTTALNDAHIAAILTHCPKLKAFRTGDFSGETALSHASLLAIAARTQDLRHLYLWGLSHQGSADNLRALARTCGNLRALELIGSDGLDFAGLTALVSNLPNVEELCLYTDQDDAVLEAIGANCPHLRMLYLDYSGSYTEKGLVAVAMGCTALKQLSYHAEEEVLNPFGELLWKALRPGLELCGDGVGLECSVWGKLLDVEREEFVVW
jgi:hypothetical protein